MDSSGAQLLPDNNDASAPVAGPEAPSVSVPGIPKSILKDGTTNVTNGAIITTTANSGPSKRRLPTDCDQTEEYPVKRMAPDFTPITSSSGSMSLSSSTDSGSYSSAEDCSAYDMYSCTSKFDSSVQKKSVNPDNSLASSAEETSDSSSMSICSFSDEVLLNILKYTDSHTLENFGETCQRFQSLICDHYLWFEFDYLTKPMMASEIMKRLHYLTDKTRAFRVCGLRHLHPAKRSRYNTVTRNMLELVGIRCPALTEIRIENAMIDIEEVTVHCLSADLTKLYMKNCDASSLSRNFFNRIDKHLVKLTELRLENCDWFMTHQLISLSKLPNLKLLSLRGCQSLKECVPYGSVATRFGFQALETLDIRDTPISDSEVQCFNITKSLRTLLLEMPKNFKEEAECHYCETANANYPNHQRTVGTSTTPSSSSSSASTSSASASTSTSNTSNGTNAAQDGASTSSSSTSASSSSVPEAAAAAVASPSSSSSSSSSASSSPVVNPAAQGRRQTCPRHRVPTFISAFGQQQVINVVVDVNGPNLVAQRPPIDDFPLPPHPFPVQQQLIIVRNVSLNGQNNNAPRQNRLDWEVVYDGDLANQYGVFHSHQRPLSPHVSDRGICSFGRTRRNLQPNLVWIRAEQRMSETMLENLVVRGYKGVTDITLRHLAECAPNLRRLDVTGTSITMAGVAEFLDAKPNCELIHDADVAKEPKPTADDPNNPSEPSSSSDEDPEPAALNLCVT